MWGHDKPETIFHKLKLIEVQIVRRKEASAEEVKTKKGSKKSADLGNLGIESN